MGCAAPQGTANPPQAIQAVGAPAFVPCACKSCVCTSTEQSSPHVALERPFPSAGRASDSEAKAAAPTALEEAVNRAYGMLEAGRRDYAQLNADVAALTPAFAAKVAATPGGVGKVFERFWPEGALGPSQWQWLGQQLGRSQLLRAAFEHLGLPDGQNGKRARTFTGEPGGIQAPPLALATAVTLTIVAVGLFALMAWLLRERTDCITAADQLCEPCHSTDRAYWANKFDAWDQYCGQRTGLAETWWEIERASDGQNYCQIKGLCFDSTEVKKTSNWKPCGEPMALPAQRHGCEGLGQRNPRCMLVDMEKTVADFEGLALSASQWVYRIDWQHPVGSRPSSELYIGWAHAVLEDNLDIVRWAMCYVLDKECPDCLIDLLKGSERPQYDVRPKGDETATFYSPPGSGVFVRGHDPSWTRRLGHGNDCQGDSGGDIRGRMYLALHLAATVAHEQAHQCGYGLWDALNTVLNPPCP